LNRYWSISEDHRISYLTVAFLLRGADEGDARCRATRKKTTLKLPDVKPGNWRGEILDGYTDSFGQAVQTVRGGQSNFPTTLRQQSSPIDANWQRQSYQLIFDSNLVNSRFPFIQP
jgi:hypothetical protein